MSLSPDTLRTIDTLASQAVKSAALKPEVELKPYQQEAVDKAKGTDGILMYMGTGSGKTLASIAASESANAPANVLVPAALRNNYKKDLAKFTDDPSKYEIQSYDRAAKATPDARPTLVLDEVQRLRNMGRQYEGAMAAARQADKRILLSGTPIVNSPGDLASIINLVKGQQLYDPESFEKEFVGQKTTGKFLGLFGKGRIEPTVANRQKLLDLLRGHVHYVGDAQESKPQVQVNEVPVEMSRAQNRINSTLQDAAPAWVRWAVKHNLPVDKQQSPALNAFLSGQRQVSNSTYGFDARMDPLKAFDQSPKLREAFHRTQEELKKPNGKMMLYSNFPQVSHTPFAAALDKAGIPYVKFDGTMSDAARKAAVDAYNSGKARVVLIGPAGAEGISLKGTSAVSMLEPHWNEARSQQASARAVRLDSHTHLPADLRNVRIDQYVAEPRRTLMGRLLGLEPPVGADKYLYTRAAEKQKLLDQFNKVLQQAGT